MSNGTPVVVSPQTPSTPLVAGQPMPYEWLKFFQNLAQAVNNALTILGQFNGVLGPSASVQGHAGTVQNIVQHLTAAGQLASLTNVASDVNLDHVADTATYQRTTANDVAGAQIAYAALVASGPTAAKALLFNGTDWHPSDVPYSSVTGAPPAPNNSPVVPTEFLTGYAGPNFSKAQPAFTDISGQLDPSQLPGTGLSVTIVTAALTTLGTQGSQTFTNGILTAQTPAT